MSKDSVQLNYPADVPKYRRNLYFNNWRRLTYGTGRLLLLAGDQRIEHLNEDFFGPNIDLADNDPEHFFQIANQAPIGAAAVHYGLASRYAANYRKINYVIKLNGKTNLTADDPDSYCLASIDQSIELSKQAGFNLVGVGYTIYLGSRYEGRMLAEAAEIVREAHDNGLLAILWIYPKGVNVKNENSSEVIAGAAGVAISLGADFVKLKSPKPLNTKNIKRIVQAAGLTKVVFAGGSSQAADKIFTDANYQIQAGAAGLAIGRNIHQCSLVEASRRLKVLSAIIYEGKTVQQALRLQASTSPKKTNSRQK